MSEVTLAANAGKPVSGEPVPHADAPSELPHINGHSQQDGSPAAAAAKAETMTAEAMVLSTNVAHADHCTAPAQPDAASLQQPAPVSNGIHEAQRPSQEAQHGEADAQGGAKDDAGASDTAGTQRHEYVDVITRGAGVRSSVHLRDLVACTQMTNPRDKMRIVRLKLVRVGVACECLTGTFPAAQRTARPQ